MRISSKRRESKISAARRSWRKKSDREPRTKKSGSLAAHAREFASLVSNCTGVQRRYTYIYIRMRRRLLSPIRLGFPASSTWSWLRRSAQVTPQLRGRRLFAGRIEKTSLILVFYCSNTRRLLNHVSIVPHNRFSPRIFPTLTFPAKTNRTVESTRLD